MPKRNISDLGPNECIHCPTEESKRLLGISVDSHPDYNVYYPYKKTMGVISQPKNKGHIIYPRKDFFDEELDDYGNPADWKRVNPKKSIQQMIDDGDLAYNENGRGDITEKQSDTTHVRPGQFKTYDDVEVNIMTYGYEKGRVKGVFYGYTTNGGFLASLPEYDNDLVLCSDCRHLVTKQQYTISCSDEVLEKVKQIDGLDFIS